jgi:hypothetical protein
MFRRLLFYCIAVFLWGLLFILIKTTFVLMVRMFSNEATGNCFIWMIAFFAGFIFWFLIYSSSSKLLKSYVLSHELTHLLWALVMGSSVKKIKVGTTQGRVVLDEVNPFIALAPYFFPFYTIVLLAMYAVLLLFWDYSWLHILFALCFGLTLAYHYTFTFKSLYEGQSDVKVYGRFFSYALIFCMNIVVINVFLLAFTSLTFLNFANEFNVSINWFANKAIWLGDCITKLFMNHLTR